MTSTQFTDFLARVFQQAGNHSIRGAIHQICMDWRHAREMLAAGDRVYHELLNICVWNKTNAGMGSLYRSQHELIFVWQNGKGPHTNNIELGRHGRTRSNVWTYAGVNTFKRARMDELAMHPTVKPVALVSDAIKDCSSRGDLILDPFAGSGTILIAAERTGRRARALEIDPHYVDVAIRRWQNYSGRLARHLDTCLMLDELEERRGAPDQSQAAR